MNFNTTLPDPLMLIDEERDTFMNIFWSSGMTNPLTVIEQITYLRK